MKSDNEIEDEQLARWLAGELSGPELEKFKSTDAYLDYKSIADISDKIKAFEYDTPEEYKKLKSKIDEKKTKVIKMPRRTKIAIAASMALLIGITGFFMLGREQIDSNSISVATGKGNTKTIVLKDKSEILLNIASAIEYDTTNWQEKREIKMSGEVYFKVSKGKPFIVTTNHGTIEVLGTQFNIRNRQKTTEIICYEGKVRVTDLGGNIKTLTKGMAIRMIDGDLDKKWTPQISDDAAWKNGSSSFHMIQLENVIEELENQFKLEIDCQADISERLYVGEFLHDNLDQALKLVFNPMELSYTIKDNKVTVKEYE